MNLQTEAEYHYAKERLNEFLLDWGIDDNEVPEPPRFLLKPNVVVNEEYDEAEEERFYIAQDQFLRDLDQEIAEKRASFSDEADEPADDVGSDPETDAEEERMFVNAEDDEVPPAPRFLINQKKVEDVEVNAAGVPIPKRWMTKRGYRR